MTQHNEKVVNNSNDLNKLGTYNTPKKKIPTSFTRNKIINTDPPETIVKKLNEQPVPESPKVSKVLSKVSKHFNLKGAEEGIVVKNPDDEKIKKSVEDLEKTYKKINDNTGNMKSIQEEGSLLASAQNALSKIEGEPTKEKLLSKLKEKDEKEGKAENILKKIKELELLDKAEDGSETVNKDRLQNKVEKNHQVQSDHIDEELKLLDKFKKLTSSIPPNNIKGKGKDGEETSLHKISSEAEKKSDEKKDEKETKRKKHWWERVFFHNNKDGDKNNTVVNSEDIPKSLKTIETDLNSGETQFFAYYCFVAITIFTITLFSAYNNKEIYSVNEKLMKDTKGLYIFGLVILIFFLLSLSLSFGHDKELKQKLASFILLNGSIYMGAYYTYLQNNGSLKDLGVIEKLISDFIIFLFILFLLASVAYVLFEKRKGKFGRIFGIIYLLTCIIGFFPLGGTVTAFNSKLKIPKHQAEGLLVPLCTIFFAVGIFLFISVVIDSVPALSKIFSGVFDTVFNVLEPIQVKYLIVASLAMSIYYTYIFYKAYNSKYISGDPKDARKFPDKKDEGVFKLMKPSYTLGLILILTIIFSLALSFGGDVKEQLAAIFLTLFVIICGSYLTYLEGENKIKDVNKEESAMTTATIAIFIILLVGCIFFTVFGKKSGREVLIKDALKVISNFGAIGLFFYMFGIGTAVGFSEFLWEYSGSWPGASLWAGFGISLLIIVVFIGSFFI